MIFKFCILCAESEEKGHHSNSLDVVCIASTSDIMFLLLPWSVIEIPKTLGIDSVQAKKERT